MADTVGVPPGVTIRAASATATTQYPMAVNSDGSINVAVALSASSAVQISDGTTPSQKATVTTAGAQVVQGLGVSYTDRSGTLTTGSTALTIMASNSSRTALIVQNPVNATETLFVAIGKSASTTSGSYSLAAGGSLSLLGSGCPTNHVTVNAATTAHAFNASEG